MICCRAAWCRYGVLSCVVVCMVSIVLHPMPYAMRCGMLEYGMFLQFCFVQVFAIATVVALIIKRPQNLDRAEEQEEFVDYQKWTNNNKGIDR